VEKYWDSLSTIQPVGEYGKVSNVNVLVRAFVDHIKSVVAG
jgi:hypothetical protein